MCFGSIRLSVFEACFEPFFLRQRDIRGDSSLQTMLTSGWSSGKRLKQSSQKSSKLISHGWISTAFPVRRGNKTPVCWREVISTGVVPDLHRLRLRDPKTFSVGGVHQNIQAWEELLHEHPQKEQIREWIKNKVDILKFSQSFSGSFKGARYETELPPRKMFPNHPSCRKYSEFRKY